MYKNRLLSQKVRELTNQFPVLILTGPRQSGKTTMFQHDGGDRRYVTLDLLDERALANENPELFLSKHPPPVTIDEVQYAPNLLSYIKVEVDKNRKPGLFWLTGSQQLHLMEAVKETLAGRVAIVNLLGFSMAEMQDVNLPKSPWLPQPEYNISMPATNNAYDIFSHIIEGSLPAISVEKTIKDLNAFYGSYITTYIERDVRSIVSVAGQLKFEAFITALAARSAQLLNLNEVAKEVGISQPTAERWLSVLIASFQVFLLRPYYKNLTKRMIKTPKLYFLDTGVLCYLTKWRSAETALSGAAAGNLFETFVVSEIIKSYWHRGMQAPLWFFRTYDKAKIDIMIESEGAIYTAEIKMTPPRSAVELRALKSVDKLGMKQGHNVVISLTDKITPISRDVSIVPVSCII